MFIIISFLIFFVAPVSALNISSISLDGEETNEYVNIGAPVIVNSGFHPIYRFSEQGAENDYRWIINGKSASKELVFFPRFWDLGKNVKLCKYNDNVQGDCSNELYISPFFKGLKNDNISSYWRLNTDIIGDVYQNSHEVPFKLHFEFLKNTSYSGYIPHYVDGYYMILSSVGTLTSMIKYKNFNHYSAAVNQEVNQTLETDKLTQSLYNVPGFQIYSYLISDSGIKAWNASQYTIVHNALPVEPESDVVCIYGNGKKKCFDEDEINHDGENGAKPSYILSDFDIGSLISKVEVKTGYSVTIGDFESQGAGQIFTINGNMEELMTFKKTPRVFINKSNYALCIYGDSFVDESSESAPQKCYKKAELDFGEITKVQEDLSDYGVSSIWVNPQYKYSLYTDADGLDPIVSDRNYAVTWNKYGKPNDSVVTFMITDLDYDSDVICLVSDIDNKCFSEEEINDNGKATIKELRLLSDYQLGTSLLEIRVKPGYAVAFGDINSEESDFITLNTSQFGIRHFTDETIIFTYKDENPLCLYRDNVMQGNIQKNDYRTCFDVSSVNTLTDIPFEGMSGFTLRPGMQVSFYEDSDGQKVLGKTYYSTNTWRSSFPPSDMVSSFKLEYAKLQTNESLARGCIRSNESLNSFCLAKGESRVRSLPDWINNERIYIDADEGTFVRLSLSNNFNDKTVDLIGTIDHELLLDMTSNNGENLNFSHPISMSVGEQSDTPLGCITDLTKERKYCLPVGKRSQYALPSWLWKKEVIVDASPGVEVMLSDWDNLSYNRLATFVGTVSGSELISKAWNGDIIDFSKPRSMRVRSSSAELGCIHDLSEFQKYCLPRGKRSGYALPSWIWKKDVSIIAPSNVGVMLSDWDNLSYNRIHTFYGSKSNHELKNVKAHNGEFLDFSRPRSMRVK
ncbi:hypothetical protein ACPV5O_25660 [Vibrio maritimus]|uniref:hypothetical protein n=1 Tax=Vibrio maritimus TaxID=990268 RepID=UPI0040683F75